METIFTLVAIAGALALLVVLVNAIANYVSEAHAQQVADQMQDILHAKSIEVDLEYYENAQYYDTLHRAQQEAPYRPTRIAKGLIGVAQSGLSLAAMAVAVQTSPSTASNVCTLNAAAGIGCTPAVQLVRPVCAIR